MKDRGAGILTGVGATLLVVATLLGAWWIITAPQATGAKGTSQVPPAVVAKPLKEDQINTITLTAEAVQRLALATALVTREKVSKSRVYGGEVLVPPGQAVIVSAPVGGTLQGVAQVEIKPGEAVQAGQHVFDLQPLLTPEGRANLVSAAVQAEGDAKNAESMREATQIALGRAKRVYANEAGSRRLVDEAQAQFSIAEQSLAAASKRREALESLLGEASSGQSHLLSIESPRDGILRSVSGVPGQAVPAGAALFEVIDLRRVWIRVSAYVGDLPQINQQAPALVGSLADKPGMYTTLAQPIAAPPSANALAAAADVYYEVENTQSQYRPGQRVGVQIALGTAAESLVAPWGAVIHDIYGGTWVYEQVAENTYVRRRVTVAWVVDGKAMLASGPAAGTPVVVAGAAELFGTETGFTK